LYTLVPDNLLTLRYLLGATDDLIEYYSSFPGMNLTPSVSGLKINELGWFNDDRIEFLYKIHKLNPIWLSLVSRSVELIGMVGTHDWLRKRAGSEYGGSHIQLQDKFKNTVAQLRSKSDFFSVSSPDFTMNSRMLVSDLLSSAVNNGLDIMTGAEAEAISDKNSIVHVNVLGSSYRTKNVVVCSPVATSKFFDFPIKTSYAPMAVVESIPDNENSFVELDYWPRKCINLLKKGNSIGLAGGITLDNKSDIKSYLKYVIERHKRRNPSLKVVDSYVGLKQELVKKGENRNYLYHINQTSPNVWTVVLGKFTLAFSMAPEFYRRVYNKNPNKIVKVGLSSEINPVLSETAWQEIISNKRR
ncbi:hypothetical protein OAI44_00005, partial [Oceanospirillaceae bacterium]|nr:hypothetical protein [Oceanospirillaceae bacterium]